MLLSIILAPRNGNQNHAEMRTTTILAYIAAILVQVSFPLALTLYFRNHSRARWKVFGYGLIVFAVSQIFTWLPINFFLDGVVGNQITSHIGAFFWLVVMALATSLWTEGARWLGYKYLFPRNKLGLTWENGVMYGLGYASMESMLLFAGITLIYFIVYLVHGLISQGMLIQSLDPSQVALFNENMVEIMNTSWARPAVVALERVLMVGHQLAWSLLVMMSHIAHRKRWFVFAVIYHLVIAVAVPGLARLYGFVVAETVNFLFAVVSVFLVIRLRSLLEEELLY